MDTSPQLTPLGTLSQRELIARLMQGSTAPHLHEEALGIAMQDGTTQVATHVLLTEGIHFDLTYHPLGHLGHKAVSLAVARILAMNATPLQAIVGLAPSSRFSIEALEELLLGMQTACTDYAMPLAQLDMQPSTKGLGIFITALGSTPSKHCVHPTGAGTHDVLCVTGELAGAYMGLKVLEREKRVWQADPHMTPELADYSNMVERQLKPRARIDILEDLHEAGVVPTAMVHVAHGLADAALQLSSASAVGITLQEAQLPINMRTYTAAVHFQLDPIQCALHGGEDCELLFTIRAQDHAKLVDHPDISCIGHTTPDAAQRLLVTKAGKQVPLQAQRFTPQQPAG